MRPTEVKKIADELLESGVGTKEQYARSVPLIFQMRDAVKKTKDWLAALNATLDSLSEAAATYAIDHATALDEPLSTEKDGIESGAVTIDGKTYRLTLSLDMPMRISGGNLTQSFLKGLPKKWVGSKLSLATSALAGTSPDELARYDLKRDVLRGWSVPESI